MRTLSDIARDSILRSQGDLERDLSDRGLTVSEVMAAAAMLLGRHSDAPAGRLFRSGFVRGLMLGIEFSRERRRESRTRGETMETVNLGGPLPEQRKQHAIKRCEQLAERFAELNKTPGLPPITPPPDLDRMAHMNAIAQVLIEKGLVSAIEFEAVKAEQIASLLEQSLEQAREVHKQMLVAHVPVRGQG